MRYLLVLLLSACSYPPVYQNFEPMELLPKPAPGIVILPPEKPKVVAIRVSTKVEYCEATYHNLETEILARLKCLKNSR